MTEAEWLACADASHMWAFGPIGAWETDRRHRLFAVCCCRRIWHWMPDEQSRQAIAILELFADGQCAESDREVALTALLKQGDPLAALRGPQELAMSAALACAGANGKDGLRLAIEVAEDCAAAV